jgi:hypothetical protein
MKTKITRDNPYKKKAETQHSDLSHSNDSLGHYIEEPDGPPALLCLVCMYLASTLGLSVMTPSAPQSSRACNETQTSEVEKKKKKYQSASSQQANNKPRQSRHHH